MSDPFSSNGMDPLKGKNVLITGSSGFIGAALLERLKNRCNVTVLSRNGESKGCGCIQADIRDTDAINRQIRGLDIEVIFHLAGKIYSRQPQEELEFLDVNAIGTKSILEVCRRNDIEKMIYSSSMAIYGDALYLPVDEAHPYLSMTPYGISKLVGEIYCKEYGRFYGLDPCILRYSHVYGPGQHETWVTSIFIRNALQSKPLEIFGDGTSSGDFVYVEDVVSANILASVSTHSKGEVFNIGAGKETTIKDLAQLIRDLCGKGALRFVQPDSPGKRFFFSIKKATEILGYSPMFSLQEGLSEQIRFARQTTGP